MRVLPELTVTDAPEAVSFFEDFLDFTVVRASGVGRTLQCRLTCEGQDLLVKSGKKRGEKVVIHFMMPDLSPLLERLDHISKTLPQAPQVQRSFFGISEIRVELQGYSLRFHQQRLCEMVDHGPSSAKPAS
jgi:catechol 2,3-dioxygenase-like lactoylglutathione lyase family enzyme